MLPASVSEVQIGRTDMVERRVTAPLVVEAFDVIEELHRGLATALEVLAENNCP